MAQVDVFCLECTRFVPGMNVKAHLAKHNGSFPGVPVGEGNAGEFEKLLIALGATPAAPVRARVDLRRLRPLHRSCRDAPGAGLPMKCLVAACDRTPRPGWARCDRDTQALVTAAFGTPRPASTPRLGRFDWGRAESRDEGLVGAAPGAPRDQGALAAGGAARPLAGGRSVTAAT